VRLGSSKRSRGVLKVQVPRHLYGPDGYELGVYASLEEARQSAREASEFYAAWSEEHLDPLEPMFLEEYAQLEEPDSFGESEEPPFDLEGFLREQFKDE